MDHYAVFDLQRDCSIQDIKKAYYAMAHKHHPDKGGDAKEFIRYSESYKWLIENHGKVVPMQGNVIIITYGNMGGNMWGSSTTTGFY